MYRIKSKRNVLRKILIALIVANVFFANAKEHPYIFYTESRVEKLKQRIKTDTLLANSWNKMYTRCEQWVKSDKGGNIEQLAFAYCMTNDKRFAERTKQLLLELVSKKQWDGMDDRSPRWNSGLASAHNNWLAAVSYDAVYNTLTKEERKNIAAKIVELGIQPSIGDWVSADKRIHTLNSMGHNWWSSVVFQAGIASLAVMNEVPEAKKWAADIMEYSKEWFAFAGSVLENKPVSFDENGGFYESVSYANFGVSEYLLFRVAWTNTYGAIQMPYDNKLQRTVDWFMNACYPRTGMLMSLNFGDSNDFANGDRPAKLLIALGLADDNYYWYLQQTAKNDFREDLNIGTPMGLLYQPQVTKISEQPALPLSAIYPDMGWAMMRNSWKSNSTLLAVKSGFTWNHAHADAGSFVLYHNGENLLIDGGDVGYGNPEYSSYFVTSKAHNVMMFNGVAQDPQDQYYAVKNPGHLYHLIDGGNTKYVLADATGPTSRNFLRNYRNFLWIGNVILIIDDVHTYETGQFDFLLHYADSAVKKGPDFEITKNKAGVLFRPLYPETLPLGYPHDFPEKLKYRTEYGIKDRTTNVKIPYYVLSAPEKTNRTKFVNAIILLNDKNKVAETFTGSSGANGAAGRTNLPTIEKFEGTNYIGVRITQDGQTTEVYINLLADGRLMHRNSILTINGWETDAYITAITYPESKTAAEPSDLTSLFIANGSMLRKNNQVVLNTLSKVFMNIDYNRDVPEIVLQGQSIIRADLFTNKKVTSVKLNDKVGKAVYTDKKLLELKVGE